MEAETFSHLPLLENIASQPDGTSDLKPFERARITLKETSGAYMGLGLGNERIPPTIGTYFVAGRGVESNGCVIASLHVNAETDCLHCPVTLPCEVITGYSPEKHTD